MDLGRRTGRLALVAGALSSILVECAAFTTASTATDAGALDAAAAEATTAPSNGEGAALPACNPDERFGSPSLVAGITSPSAVFARLSGDELKVVFEMNEANDVSQKPQVWQASRAARTDGFGPATLIAVTVPGGGWDPALSRDGRTLVFATGRLSKSGGRDIFLATRPTSEADFDAPVSVAAINDNNDEAGPYLEPGNAHLWFFRIGGGTRTIWVAAQAGDTFGTPTFVSELNEGAVGFPIPSDDGTYIYFSSDQGDDAGLGHIWIAQRVSPDGPFAGARPVTELNSSDAGDTPTWLSPDGCRLYLTSSRPGPSQVYVAERSP